MTTTTTGHLVRSNTGAWSCSCGAGGKGNSVRSGDEFGRAHANAALTAQIPGLSREEFAAALTIAASDTPRELAAVQLIIWHEHWLGYGYLRRFVHGDWWSNGTGIVLHLGIRWEDLLAAIDACDHPQNVLIRMDPAGRILDSAARKSAAVRLDADRTAREAHGQMIRGSSSEIAILQIAATIAGHGQINLNRITSGLGNATRAAVLTAIGVMLDGQAR